MPRFRLTFAVALTLTAVYQLYAQWSESFTAKVTDAQRPVIESRAPIAPVASGSPAEQVLPGEDWIRTAGYTFQRGEELFLYANTAKPVENPATDGESSGPAERIEFRPFALVWTDPDDPDATPYTVRCDSARIQFENPVEISFSAESPGRLQAATFEGTVRITGPDGLWIEGDTFDFSEESLRLYSGNPLKFRYGPTADNAAQVLGSSSRGISVDFLPSVESELGTDLPRIGGVKRVRLLRNIVLDCEYETRDPKDEQPRRRTAHIQCEESLDFNAVLREAILLKNVFVRSPTGGPANPDEADTLHCHQLSLQFAEAEPDRDAPIDVAETAPAAPAEEPKRVRSPLGNLQAKFLQAAGNAVTGSRAMLQSASRGILARFQVLKYDFETETAVLSDAEDVVVQREHSQLHSPVIRWTADAASGGDVVSCEGLGRLQQADPETGAPLFDAMWDRQLHAAPDPATELLLVSMDGNAKVMVEQRAGMRADQLFLWIDDKAAADPRSDKRTGTPGPGERLVKTPRANEEFPLQFIEARGGVVMASMGPDPSSGPALRFETELLRAKVLSGKLRYADEDQNDSAPGAPDEVVSPTGEAGSETQLTGGEAPQQEKPDGPWRLASQEIYLTLLNEPGTRDLQVSQAQANRNVSADSESVGDDGAPVVTSLRGAQALFINEGGSHQSVHFIGAPALLRRGNLSLECRDLQCDRFGNEIKVVGEGLLQAPVYRDLNGASLDQPMVLDVKWAESMTFDGAQATFAKNVFLQLHDSVLQCDEMDVRLMRPLDFSGDRPDDEDVEIRDVSCRNGVHVEIYDWEENRIVGIRKGDLTQFYLDYQSGHFQGDGPGLINHWSRNAGRRIAVAQSKPAQANTPAASNQLEWEHISVAFDDLLRGNFETRTAELHGRVRMTYAPVRHVSETFSRNDLSEPSHSAEHAVWLGCNQLAIEMLSRPDENQQTPDGQDDYLVMHAKGECEIEGQLFNGKADSLSYDESKEQFTLRGKGDREASIYYRERLQSESIRIGAQTIWAFPSLGEYTFEKSSGFQGTR